MNNLLKAMGFWIWGLVAVAISVSLVSVSYRGASYLSGAWHLRCAADNPQRLIPR